MLSDSVDMEEWREFYEDGKTNSRRPRTFPKFHDYMKEKLVDVDEMVAPRESVPDFSPITNDIRTLVHGPLTVVTTR